MSSHVSSRAPARAARDPYCNDAAQARVGVPRCARNDNFRASAAVTVGCLVLGLLLSSSSLPAHAATTLTGKVTNGTTGKPAAGSEVILLKLSEGMQEEARTKSDAQGRFALLVNSPEVAHLVRVVHQKVNYHRPVPGHQFSGSTSIRLGAEAGGDHCHGGRNAGAGTIRFARRDRGVCPQE